MSRKIEYSNLIPNPEDILKVLRAGAPHFYRCPGGHALPHRMIYGRCTPLLCLDAGEPGTVKHTNRESEGDGAPYRAEMDAMPRGMEHEVLDRDVHDEGNAIRVAAQSKEALGIMRSIGVNAAQNSVHPMPELPDAPALKSGGERDYVDKRLDQAAPLAAEILLFDLKFGPRDVRRALAEKILGMRGFSPKSDALPDFRGPVVVVNNIQAPYDAQRTLKRAGPTTQLEAINHEEAKH
jgi:hypothetical protein